MHLRTNVRPPGRYREGSVEDLPPNPRFVVPTIPFNPNLRRACFPTLQWDELALDHPAVLTRQERGRKEREEREKGLQKQQQNGEKFQEVSAASSESGAKSEASQGSQRPAIAFRDTRTVPVMEQEDGLVQGPDGRWISTLEPGEFDPYAVNFDDEVENEQRERDERWFLPALNEQKYWDDLSNGIKLIVIRELTTEMPFADIWFAFLQLGEQALDDFLNLCADEVKIRALQQETVARIQERQMKLLDSGVWNIQSDAFNRIYEEEMARTGDKIPATWLISREDVATAKNFLGNYRFREEFEEVPDVDPAELDRIPTFAVLSKIQDQLEMYIGVSTSFEALDFGEDFIGYLPEDVLVMEEVENGEVVRLAEVPLVPAPSPAPNVAEREAKSFNSPPMGTFKTSTPNGSPSLNDPKDKAKKCPPKKDIERDGISNELIKKKRSRGRPRKADKIIHQPSRLREVTNAEDIQSPRQSPTSGDDAAPGPAAGGAATRPITPPRTGSIQILGRSPFKQYASPYPPPKHSSSFPNKVPDQPVPDQPAPVSPPKGSSHLSESGPTAAVQYLAKSGSIVQDAVKVTDISSKSTSTAIVEETVTDSDAPSKNGPITDAQKAVKDSNVQCDNASTTIVQDVRYSDSEPPPGTLAAPKPSISSTRAAIAQVLGQAPLPKTYDSFFEQGGTTPTRFAAQSKQLTPTKIRLKAPGAQGNPIDSAAQYSPGMAAQAKRDRDADESVLQESPAKKPRLEQPDRVQQGIVKSIIDNARSVGQKLMNPFKGNGDKLPKLGDTNHSEVVKNSDTAAEVGGVRNRSEKANDSSIQRERQPQIPAPVAAKSDDHNRSGATNDLDISVDALVVDPSKTTVEVQIPAPRRAVSKTSARTFERDGSTAKKATKATAAKKPAQLKPTQHKSTPLPKASAKNTKAVKGKTAETTKGKAGEIAKGKDEKQRSRS